MIDELYALYDIPVSKRKYLIIAPPRTGSSSLLLAIKLATDLKSLSPANSPFDEKKFLEDLKKYDGVITKMDPCKQSRSFLGKLVKKYDRVVILIRENIVDHALSNTRAGYYKNYDGVYEIEEETELKVAHKKLKPKVLQSCMKQTFNALQLAIQYKIPILTYEELYTGEGEDLWKTLKEFGIKWKDIGDDKFQKILQIMNPINKYTNKKSILKNIKKPIKFL